MKQQAQGSGLTLKRAGFSSSFGVLAATLGSAVGLGNIWKFPYLTGANGGAGFLLIYLLATLLVGLPVMIAEITLGRRAKVNPISTMEQLAPKGKPWWLVGVIGMVAAFLIVAFYSEVVGWVFAYIAKAIDGSILSSDKLVTEAAFASLISNPLQSLFWQWGVLLFIGGILMLGVTKGIEAIAKKLMPLLFLLLLLLCAVSLSLDKASDGLAFFKLSVGMGTMMTYGSYFRDDQDIPLTTLRVMTADLGVSMLAGIAIFPAVFTFGFAPSAGPSLVFITIPAVFSQIPMGQFLMVAFFILAAVAATGAMLSLMEVPVVIFHERLGWSRNKATVVTMLLLALLGSACALSNSSLADFKLFNMNMFDLFDFVSSNIFLPVGGIAIALFTGWAWGKDHFIEAIGNQGLLQNRRLATVLLFLLRYVSPVLILLVMLKGLKVF